VKLCRIPWNREDEPGEYTLRRHFEAEGWEVHRWRDPSERTYGDHTHEHDESLWVIQGRIVVYVAGQEYALEAGDRLDLPKGTVRRAETGPEGAFYLIGRRFDD
jgi:quercetin dioxygenase-like cupin family protein